MTDIRTLRTIAEHASLLRTLLVPGALEGIEKKINTLSAAEQTRTDNAKKLLADAALAQDNVKKRQEQLDERARELASLKDSLDRTVATQRDENTRLENLNTLLSDQNSDLESREKALINAKADLTTQLAALKDDTAVLASAKLKFMDEQKAFEQAQKDHETQKAKLKESADIIRQQTSGL